MKKAFVAILSLAALVGCSRDVVVDAPASAIIQFGDSFVENKTRAAADPSTTTANIEEFAVWGFRGDAQELVFNNERVYKNGAEWTYDNLQYWMEGKDYFFGAVSPFNHKDVTVDTQTMSRDGLGTISFTNNDGSVDLIYADDVVDASEINLSNPQTVKLQFAHLLSRVKFSFKYNFPNELTTVAVKNIKINNSPANGSIDVTKKRAEWSWNIPQNGETMIVDFGHVENGSEFAAMDTYYESDNERLIIPSDTTHKHNITFDVVVYNNHVEAQTYPISTILEKKAFVQGKKYNIVTEITPDNIIDGGLKPIVFEVEEVEEWLDENANPVYPDQLATPDVKAEVSGNVVTLTWADVAGAANYTVQVGTNAEEVVNGTSFVFTGDYNTTYKFTVKAIAADTTKNTNSDAAVVEATTEAAPTVGPTYTTVEEFLKTEALDSKNEALANAPMYRLKGTITSVVNTTYGNFDLTDDTGTLYVYGLYSEDGATNKYWAASGAKLGDDIEILVAHATYNNTHQGANARFVELTSPGTRAFYTVDPAAVDFASAGGEQDIEVTAYNTSAAVTATSDNAAFTVDVNGYVVTVTAAANELEQKVEGNITIKVGDLEPTVVKATLAAKPAAGAVEGGSDDFHTISTNTSYVSGKTTAGWVYANCAILKGGPSNANNEFQMIGDADNRALCMNGKTSAVGSITSPTFSTGCGTLKFNYGLPFSDTKLKFRVDIMQNGAVVKTFTVDKSSATKFTLYSHEEAINVAGDFQIVFTNLSPSNSTSNKDRTAIWDVEWTGYNN